MRNSPGITRVANPSPVDSGHGIHVFTEVFNASFQGLAFMPILKHFSASAMKRPLMAVGHTLYWLLLLAACVAQAAEEAVVQSSLFDALSANEWTHVESATQRALDWMSRQQRRDGSFPTAQVGQPAVTSLCVMAFLACGHQPGEGPYGDQLNRAIDYVLESQRPDGIFSALQPQHNHVHMGASHTGSYNHAIGGLMLSEAYGQTSGEQSKRIRLAMDGALRMCRQIQIEPPKQDPADVGGWRYMRSAASRGTRSLSDLSVTAWQLMFLRSAKNTGFHVPNELVTSAMGYVERSFDSSNGVFYYGLIGIDRYTSRGLMGAGILSLSLGGQHDTEMARHAGNWLLARPFTMYGQTVGGRGDRFHYGAYYCSQAMAQLGGRYWESFFPHLAHTMLQNQQRDGSWPAERGEDSMYGPAYTTALTVLSLTPALQVLPIYQR